MTLADQALEAITQDLVAANRILAAEGVVDAFGHVSARHPHRANRFLLSQAISPELVGPADLIEYQLDGTPVDPKAPKGYLERFIHGAIYEARPDVHSVVHNHSHSVIPFTVTGEKLRPIVHSSAVIGRDVPVWDPQNSFGDTNLLIANMEMARDFAGVLAKNRGALMRGHGCTVTGKSVREAVYAAVYLEVNARLQLEAARFPPVKYLTDGEIEIIGRRLAEAKPAEGYDRAWNYWCRRAGIEPRPVGKGEIA
jgi:HCOMODA/2-hydroxy-3-carboxy-muconic semialdehyde decarboxylase